MVKNQGILNLGTVSPGYSSGDTGLITGQETKIPLVEGTTKPLRHNYRAHVPRPENSCTTTKILCAAAETQHGQIKKYFKKKQDIKKTYRMIPVM